MIQPDLSLVDFGGFGVRGTAPLQQGLVVFHAYTTYDSYEWVRDPIPVQSDKAKKSIVPGCRFHRYMMVPGSTEVRLRGFDEMTRF